ncbi:toxin biosynthesis [Seiridium cupressi]
MEDQAVIFISGVNRGIGSALARAHLSRPKYVVVGNVRSDNALEVAELKAFSKGSGSKLFLVNIESSSITDPTKAIEELESAGTNHINVLIANTAVSPPLGPLELTNTKEMASVFRINTLGPLALFQACHLLLAESTNASFRQTNMGSIAVAHLGLEKAPHTAEEGAERIINLIDNSSRENSPGSFLEAWGGNQMAW